MGLFSVIADIAGGLLGGVIGSDAQSDAVDAQTNATNQSNALQREQFEYQKQIQQPYNTAGTGALGLISTGLGIAPQVETRDQIRARLSGQNTGQGNNASFSNLGQPLQAQSPINYLGIIGTPQQQQQATEILGLQGDDSKEAKARINSYIQSMASTNQLQNANNPNLDAQVEAEYQKQLEAQKSAQGGAGFGEFNKDFTAQDFDVNKDPGAVFRQQEAMKALQRTYAGSGNFLSGGALKGITKYNQDFASQEFGNAFDRFNVNKTNRFNRLATVAGIGQTSANTVGNAGQNYANTVGNNATNLGNSIGSASLYGGRQLNNAVQSGANTISNYFQNRIPAGNANIQGYGGTTADPWYG